MITVVNCGTYWLKEIEMNLRELNCAYEIIQISKMPNYNFALSSGLIISGAPLLLSQTNLEEFLVPFQLIKTIKIPVLGICLGHQILGLLHNSEIKNYETVNKIETIEIIKSDPLFTNIGNKSRFKEEHSEYITLPDEFDLLAKSESCSNEIMKHKNKTIYGTQFHPEISNNNGRHIFINFLNMCRVQQEVHA